MSTWEGSKSSFKQTALTRTAPKYALNVVGKPFSATFLSTSTPGDLGSAMKSVATKILGGGYLGLGNLSIGKLVSSSTKTKHFENGNGRGTVCKKRERRRRKRGGQGVGGNEASFVFGYMVMSSVNLLSFMYPLRRIVPRVVEPEGYAVTCRHPALISPPK